jgi:hypothetical protein
MVCPEGVQHRVRALPLMPHSQQPDAWTNGWHTPATHTSLVVQALPQAPQWAGSVIVSVQLPEHDVSEPQPVRVHEPARQLESVHPLPQPLQLFTSVCRFTHAPLQLVSPGGQALTQLPAVQVLPPPQLVVQVPQNCGSVCPLTQAWPPPWIAQSSGEPALHVSLHAPPAHFGVPVLDPDTGSAQTLVQLPQWFTSVCSSKQPLGGHESGRLGLMHA